MLETLKTVPVSLMATAVSSPCPVLEGEIEGLLTKLAALSCSSKVFFWGGVVPDGEGVCDKTA